MKFSFFVFLQESDMCVLKEAHEWCSWAYWNEKKSKYAEFEGNGFAVEVPQLFCLSMHWSKLAWLLLVALLIFAHHGPWCYYNVKLFVESVFLICCCFFLLFPQTMNPDLLFLYIFVSFALTVFFSCLCEP